MESIVPSWSILFTLFFVALILVCSQYGLKIYRLVKRSILIRRSLRNFPGPKAHWFFGNKIPEPSEMLEWGKELKLKYARYNKFSIFFMTPIVWLRHPEPIKQILKTSEPKPMSFAGGYSSLKPWLGDGLLVSSGEKWHRNRRLLTPGFHFDILKPYISIYNETADTLISKWAKQGGNGDKAVEIYKSVSLCTLDVMLRCAFSYENDVQSSENKYVQTVNSQTELLWNRSVKPWMLLDALFNGSSHMEWDDLQKMPFFTQCIKESLRCFSPVPIVVRELTEPLNIDEFIIPPGTQVVINIIDMHQNPAVWGEDQDEFKPERFHPDNIQKMDPHAFIPFSAGPRNCIGQNFAMNEIKVVVARVLRHFEISVDEDHPIEPLPFVVLRPKSGIKLYLKPRV